MDRKPWVFDEESFNLLKVTYANILTCVRSSRNLTVYLHCSHNALLPRRIYEYTRHPRLRLSPLAPLNFRRKIVRPVSYYALFKWWLLLSQHPGCLNNLTSFTTEVILGTLDGGLGSFPCVYGTSLSQTDSPDCHKGIRSLLRVGTVVYRPSPNRALPPLLETGGYS